MGIRRYKNDSAFSKIIAWITDDPECDDSPSITAGSGVPSSSEENGSIYLRTNGTLYKRQSDAWELISELSDFKPVKVAITAAGGTGGATAGTLSIAVTDFNDNALTSAVQLAVVVNGSSDRYKGDFATPVSTVTFSSATTGSIVASGNGFAIIQTSSTGTFACTVSDSADETVYISARSLPGGVSSAGKGCTVVESNSDDAIWTS